MRKFNVGDQVRVTSPASRYCGMFGLVSSVGGLGVCQIDLECGDRNLTFLDAELELLVSANGATNDDGDFFDGIGCYIDDLEHVAELLEKIAALQVITGLAPTELAE